MRKQLVLVLVLGVLIAADKPKKPKSDKDRFQGTWEVVKGEKGGTAMPMDIKVTMTFDGDKFSVERDGKFTKGTFKIDASKKPKTLNLMITEGEGDVKGKTVLAIYELKKGQLVWCGSKPDGTDRPSKFDTKETENFAITMKRKKKDD